jgi:DNA primase
MAARKEVLEVGDRDVTITNPDKVYFPQTGHTKLDLVRYYLAILSIEREVAVVCYLAQTA